MYRGPIDAEHRTNARPPRLISSIVLAGLLLLLLTMTHRPTGARTFRFVEKAAAPADLGFELSRHESGDWVFGDDADATGGRALINLAGTATAPAASAVIADSATRDLSASTRCKIAGPSDDRACGLVFRYLGPDDHYLARADAARQKLELVLVAHGVERKIAAAEVPLDPSGWQLLSITARAEHITVSLDGKKYLDAYESTLASPGRVGLWAPSSAEAHFDELMLESLPPTAPHAWEILPFLLRRGS